MYHREYYSVGRLHDRPARGQSLAGHPEGVPSPARRGRADAVHGLQPAEALLRLGHGREMSGGSTC
jgi:hypothetical protein